MTTTTTKKPAAKAAKQIDNVFAFNGSDAFKGYEDLLQFSKDNLEAVVKSSQIVARGVQDVSKSVLGLAQVSIEESVAAGKAIVGAKTLKELVDLQSGLAKSNLDKLMAEGGRLGEATTKIAQEAFAPINERVNLAVEKFVKQA